MSDEFERKLLHDIHDDVWNATVSGFGIHDGERSHRLVPTDQDVNPEQKATVTVFTADGLAAHDARVAADALNAAADELEATPHAWGKRAWIDAMRARATRLQEGGDGAETR